MWLVLALRIGRNDEIRSLPVIRSALFLIAIVALGAFVSACALDSGSRRTAWKRRAWLAALFGSFIPLALITAIAFLARPELQVFWEWAVLRALAVGAVLAAIVGFPVAYLVTRRFERSREPDIFK